MAVAGAYGGAGNLAAYSPPMSAVPAAGFFIAGAMSALIPKETITRFLGRNSSKAVSYPAAAAAGSLLAVCSCTIVPLFAGIYKKGAGLGPAITFLFLRRRPTSWRWWYRRRHRGRSGDRALRAVADLRDRHRAHHGPAVPGRRHGPRPGHRRACSPPGRAWARPLVVPGAVGGAAAGGHPQARVLTGSVAAVDCRCPAGRLAGRARPLVPFDAAKGEEGVSVQGVLLILLLAAIGVSAWRGLENIQEGVNGWTRASLALVWATLLLAALAIRPVQGRLHRHHRQVLRRGGGLAAIHSTGLAAARRRKICRTGCGNPGVREADLSAAGGGVFIVGMARVVVRPEWIEAVAGSNTLLGNLAGVAFGVFMYFPTLVEVPIARMFLDLGMHRGPLLAYLMSDPELSLQSILIICHHRPRQDGLVWWRLQRRCRSDLRGLIDGMPLWQIALWLLVFIGGLAASWRWRAAVPLQMEGV
jgi:uncharacterized membrane protein YraQ (UPF0718 family)